MTRGFFFRLGGVEIPGTSPLVLLLLLRKSGCLPRAIVLPTPNGRRGNQFISRPRGPRIAERIQPPRLTILMGRIQSSQGPPSPNFLTLFPPQPFAPGMETPLPDLNTAMDLDDEFPPTDLFAWILSRAPLLFTRQGFGLGQFCGSQNPRPRVSYKSAGFVLTGVGFETNGTDRGLCKSEKEA